MQNGYLKPFRVPAPDQDVCVVAMWLNSVNAGAAKFENGNDKEVYLGPASAACYR
jgi:hypothetical protein